MIGTWGQDLRYAFRSLRNAPGFAAVVILTIGLGIGANTAIFSVLNALVFRSLPVPAPERLVKLFTAVKDVEGYSDFTYPDYVEIRDHNQVFSGLLGQSLLRVGLSRGDAESELLWGEIVTGNYFDVLGVKAEIGRTFLPEEDRTPNTHPVVVIAHSLWQRRFAADPGVLGTTIKLNGYPFTIIGVAPRSFHGTKYALAMDLWVPMMMRAQVKAGGSDWLTSRGDSWFDVMGRLKPGVSFERAQAEAAAFSARLQRAYPKDEEGKTIHAFREADARLHPGTGARLRFTSTLVLVLVGLVLLVACVNVINLLLARATARQAEIGMRIALGAGRGRLLRQLFTESMLLSLLGGAAGVLLAYWGTGFAPRLLPPVPYNLGLDFHPDTRALLYTLFISLLTGAILGLAPATHALRTEIVAVVKGSGGAAGSGRRFRGRKLLVIAQTAVSLMLLASTGLFVKSLIKTQSADPGFDLEHGLFGSIDLDMRNYPEERGELFYRQLRERIAAIPGVKSASFAYLVPLGDHTNTLWVYREGADRSTKKAAMLVDQNTVGVGYFSLMVVPLLRGREFTDRDTAQTPQVVIVNQTLAQDLWPGQDPIGKRVIFSGKTERPREVVGVAKGGKYHDLTEEPLPYIYLPLAQDYNAAMTLHVRTSVKPESLVNAVREAVRRMDPALPVYDVKTMRDHLEVTLWPARLGAALTAVAGLLALFLALVGIYGVMSYTVNQRSREIGIRMALGADRGNLLGLVVRQGMSLALTGIGIGLVLAFLLSLVVTKIHYGISPGDPAVFVATTITFVLVSLIASYLPARRASKIDPMKALRT
jgi:macrolide transport system ATP-binding/permease protein